MVRYYGDCFQVSAQRLMSPGFPDGLLVHGLPVNQSEEHAGKRYWHAWIEVNGTVYDFSRGKRLRIAKAEYYHLAQLTEKHVYRYDRETARSILLRTENYGPWVPGWRRLEEIKFPKAEV